MQEFKSFPFTADMERLLTSLGYVCFKHPETWRDVGGPESGPKLVGGPAWDEWRCGERCVIVQSHHVVEVLQQDPFPQFDDLPF